MFVPDKISFSFGDFYVLVIKLTYELGCPVFIKQAKFLAKIYFFHCLMDEFF